MEFDEERGVRVKVVVVEAIGRGEAKGVLMTGGDGGEDVEGDGVNVEEVEEEMKVAGGSIKEAEDVEAAAESVNTLDRILLKIGSIDGVDEDVLLILKFREVVKGTVPSGQA